MATERLCSVPECGKPHYGLGLCNKHYKQEYKKRNPSERKGEIGRHAARYLSDVVIPYTGDDCLTWPFARSSNGYSNIGINGRNARVHRIVCETVNGSPPSPKHEAAHTCGNGHEGCVNPRHVVWKTHAGNERDKVEHGTAVRGAKHALSKLSSADVLTILSLRGRLSNTKIAAQYGVCRQLVDGIMKGTKWAWLA